MVREKDIKAPRRKLSFSHTISSTHGFKPKLHFSEMAKSMGAFVCFLVVVVDIIAGILGIEAEMAQNKAKHVSVWIFECRDPSREALKLGIAAATLLALAHAIANLIGGCMCIFSREELERSSSNKQLAASCLVFSWIIFAVGFSLLIIGTLTNSKSRASCGISHRHFLSIGGVLCFVHGLFCTAYYVSATAAVGEEKTSHGPHT